MSVPKKQTLTQEELKELLHYDPETGKFTWKVQRGRQAAGTEAGAFSEALGYYLIGINGTRHYAHRLAWLYVTGEWPEEVIDHEDRNRANNKFKNLKSVSQRRNIEKAKREGGKLGVPGVLKYPPSLLQNMKRHYTARINVDGKVIGLGSFQDLKSAYEAYAEAKLKHHNVVMPKFEEYGVANV